ncbi:MAG: glycosyltransferase family 4 protein [Armatimonadota bacterium]|nr:glycosyltransferase family 4 protein [Armatimonadota bacterium]
MSHLEASSRPDPTRPLVVLVGGTDVHLRIDLIQAMRDEFAFAVCGSEPGLAEAFSRADLPYYVYPLPRGASPVGDARALLVLTRLLRRLRPSVVHAMGSKPSVVGRLAARAAGVPVVIGTIPGLGSLFARDGLSVRLQRRAYLLLQGVACGLSDLTTVQHVDDLNALVRRGVLPHRKAIVIPGSGVRTDLFSPVATVGARARVRSELGVPHDAIVVTMVARLIRAKGVAEFAEAATAVRDRRPDTAFLLVGPMDEQSIDRIPRHEMSRYAETVTWIGPRQDVPAILAASDIFVLPTYNPEGIPRVLLEAASTGLAIVTTPLPGCRDVVEDAVTGLLVPPRDGPALAGALLRLIEDPSLRRELGRRARAHAVANFDLRLIAARLQEIYHAQLDGCRHVSGREALAQ